MNLSSFSHLIFDFDSTLAKLLINWTDWHTGTEKVVQEFDQNFAHPNKFNQQEINSLIVKYGGELRKKLWQFNQKFETNHLKGVKPILKTLNLLRQQAKQNKTIFLLTSNSRATVMPLLDELKIKQLFTVIITKTDVLFIKPDPQPFSLIYDSVTPLKKYLMIGDSSSDENFAKNVGIEFLHVNKIGS